MDNRAQKEKKQLIIKGYAFEPGKSNRRQVRIPLAPTIGVFIALVKKKTLQRLGRSETKGDSWFCWNSKGGPQGSIM